MNHTHPSHIAQRAWACAAALGLALAAGCAQAPAGDGGTAEARQICTDEVPTGTTIKTRRCRSEEQVARERAAAEGTAAQVRTNVPGGQTAKP